MLGFAALAVGLTLIALIVYAMPFGYRQGETSGCEAASQSPGSLRTVCSRPPRGGNVRVSSVLPLAALGVLAVCASPLVAQGYRVEVDARVQGVEYRGWQLDSVPVDEVVVTNGLLFTADGFGVSCLAGRDYCLYYKPGDKVRALPMVATADFSVWNLGVKGLRLEGSGRIAKDGKDGPTLNTATGESLGAWPGTRPVVQIIEGYLAYDGPFYRFRGGRQTSVSRFGYVGFDGAQAGIREPRGRVGLTGRFGWSLARSALVPWTDGTLNPRAEYRPSTRDKLLGFDLDWNLPWLQGRALYQRQWLSEASTTTVSSELIGGDVTLRPHQAVSVSGGLEYDLAWGSVGNADGTLTAFLPRHFGTVTVGARRYRPRFELWSIWTAFSPVPYQAVFGQAAVRVRPEIQLRARIEKFSYQETEASTTLVVVKDDGWRYGLGASYRYSASFSASLDYQAGVGPGAQALTVDGAVSWKPMPTVGLRASAAYIERSLELRTEDNSLWQVGLDGDAVVYRGIRAFAGTWFLKENRERPDAAAIDWNQVRFHLGLRYGFGSAADRPTLPPAILRIPEGGAR